MRPLPWAKPRYELLLLALVAAAALSPVYTNSVQDASRLCLTRALEHGHVVISPCIGDWRDRAVYRGRIYSDKAPGMSALALPAAAATGLPGTQRWHRDGDLHVWAVRLLTSGLAFVLLLFLLGRVAEGLADGTGAPTIVAAGLGTMLGPLAATTFSHVTAATLAFGAFLLAWDRRPLLAGICAGCAVDVEYTTALIGVFLAVYLLRDGVRAVGALAAGAVPPLLLLGAYDWAAFGSPFHLSYRYVSNSFSSEQHSGFFGIGAPHAHSLVEVLVGSRGLLVVSPLSVAAGAGLVLLARQQLAEAAVCLAAVAAFFLVNAGYFLPYGGESPGPRFLVPSLPFLALGLAPALARARRVTLVLIGASVVATVATMLTWMLAQSGYPATVWGELVRVPAQAGSSRLVQELSHNVLDWAGSSRTLSAAIVCACAAAACVLAVRPAHRR